MPTKEDLSRENNVTASQVELRWQWKLDALVRGECGEDDFINELVGLRKVASDSAWNVLALLAQRYRRGQMPVDLFRSIESKIVQGGLDSVDFDITINLDVAPATQRDVPGYTNHVQTAQGLADDLHTHTFAVQATPLEAPLVAVDGRSTSSIPDIGRVLRNRYVLESRLGSGGMGTVFRAIDRYRCDLTEDNRFVAIKVLHDDSDGRPEVLANLRREFFCAQALSHRSIVKVYELDLDDDVAFFTMELLRGELLSAVIERSRPMPISRSRAWEIIRELGDGLAHAHERNVVHGDLKPQNVMIVAADELRVLDFGASQFPALPQACAGGVWKNTVNLTPAYACCQLLEGQQADPRDDLFALACISYELLAGEHPFQGQMSTEARDHGLLARRPAGLTGLQWHTLAMGLSWRREGRTILVRDWIKKLDPKAAPAEPLARLPELVRAISVRDWTAQRDPIPVAARPRAGWGQLVRNSGRSFRRAMPSSRVAVSFAILVVGLSAWLSFQRISFDRKIGGHWVGSSAALNTPINADAVSYPQNLLLDGMLLPESASMGPPWPDTVPVVGAAPEQATLAASSKNGPPRIALQAVKLNKTSIYAETPTIGSRDRFVEIHVRRSSGSDGDTTFAWWTDASSAKPGIDYVPQARMVQLLPKGSRLASLFIRIIQNASRKNSAMFYVTIADPGNDAVGHLARTAILLPPSK